MRYVDYLDETEREKMQEALASLVRGAHVRMKSGIIYAEGDDVVFLAPPADYPAYALALLGRYYRRSCVSRRVDNGLQITIFAGAALVTAALAVEGVPKFIPVLLSAIVALATALANFYKFAERSRALYLTAERIALEYNRFDNGRGQYKDMDEQAALHLFMDRVEGILHEDTQRRFALERLADEQRTGVSKEGQKS
jgi:hypothetical protein